MFAEDIKEGTIISCFCAVRELREGEDCTRTLLGYNFIVKDREGRALTITTIHGVTEECVVHAINHTCHPGFVNCKFLHTGITNNPHEGGGGADKGDVGGRRTSDVFVETTRRVERDAELLANYGTKFR